MPDSMTRCRDKALRFWEAHGSWMLLILIGISCFMAGSQFAAEKNNDKFRMLIEAHDRQDAERVARINKLMDGNRELSLALGRVSGDVADKAGAAAESAERAAETASQAVIQSGGE